jgi:hypothetical protein
VVQPDPCRLEEYQSRAGKRRDRCSHVGAAQKTTRGIGSISREPVDWTRR